MKTFETEKHNIPEGATHYRNECKDFTFVWVKQIAGKEYVWNTNSWYEAVVINRDLEIAPIPQTNIETPEEKEALDSIDVKLIKPRKPSKPVITKVEWGGAGLPPVGVECEVMIDNSGKWRPCEILFSSKNSVVIVKLKSGSELAVDPFESSFRKAESSRQREERERAEAIYEMCSSADNFTEESHFWAGKFYDLGYKRDKL